MKDLLQPERVQLSFFLVQHTASKRENVYNYVSKATSKAHSEEHNRKLDIKRSALYSFTSMTSSEPLWLKYEYQVIEDYRQRYNAIAYPWNVVPTQMLIASGYLDDIGDARRRRLRDGAPMDYGFDGFGCPREGIFYGIQAKMWTQGTLDSRELGSFLSAAMTIRENNRDNGAVLYHAPGSKVSSNVMYNFKPESMRVHQVAPVDTEILTQDQPQTIDESSFTLTETQQKALQFLNEQPAGSVSLLAMACATGKTLVYGTHADAAEYDIVIVAAPLIASAEQNLNRVKGFLRNHAPVAFYSGSSPIDVEGCRAALTKGKCLIATTFCSAGDLF